MKLLKHKKIKGKRPQADPGDRLRTRGFTAAVSEHTLFDRIVGQQVERYCISGYSNWSPS
jgi:hypothetical protein